MTKVFKVIINCYYYRTGYSTVNLMLLLVTTAVIKYASDSMLALCSNNS